MNTVSPYDYVTGVLRTESPNFAAAALLSMDNEEFLSVAEAEFDIANNDPDLLQLNRLLHASMGMSNEANEFLDHIRGVLFYNKPLDETNLKEEVGDMLYFIGLALVALNSGFDVEMGRNLAKLQARYPSKFNTEDYANRDLAAERAVLEAGTPTTSPTPEPEAPVLNFRLKTLNGQFYEWPNVGGTLQEDGSFTVTMGFNQLAAATCPRGSCD